MGRLVLWRNPRPIIAAFRDDPVKQPDIMNVKKLAGKPFSIQQDYPAEIHKYGQKLREQGKYGQKCRARRNRQKAHNVPCEAADSKQRFPGMW